MNVFSLSFSCISARERAVDGELRNQTHRFPPLTGISQMDGPSAHHRKNRSRNRSRCVTQFTLRKGFISSRRERRRGDGANSLHNNRGLATDLWPPMRRRRPSQCYSHGTASDGGEASESLCRRELGP